MAAATLAFCIWTRRELFIWTFALCIWSATTKFTNELLQRHMDTSGFRVLPCDRASADDVGFPFIPPPRSEISVGDGRIRLAESAIV